MANHSPKDTEILVHITAPSRATDDVLYRRLAQAYLDFQPQTRTEIVLAEPPQEEGEKQTQEEIIVATGFEASTPQQAFDINSQDISFQSVLDNRASPQLGYGVTDQAVVPPSQSSVVASQTSWCAPPSQISDSYPMPEPGLLSMSPSRVLRQYIGQVSGSTLLRSSPLSPSPIRKRDLPPLSSLESVDLPFSLPSSDQQEVSTSKVPLYIQKRPTIPVTPSITAGIAKSPSKTRQLRPLQQGQGAKTGNIPLDISHISNSIESGIYAAGSPRSESEPPPPKRLKATQAQHADLVRSISDTGPVPPCSNPLVDEIHSLLEIRPPSPPAGMSILTPEDMISEKFAKLAKDLHGRYRPESKRTVEPFERGYWLLDCKTWDRESRMRMWVFLNNYLHRQLAGWGTWCRRDENFEWMRLYCWGHVVEHTYLLLYVSSERYLKRTSTAWYDAGGELVIEVPPHDNR